MKLSQIKTYPLTATQKILFWPVISCIFFLFTTSILAIGPHENIDLFLWNIFSLLILWRYPKKGVYFCYSILCILGLIKHVQLQDYHVWQLGLELSFGLSFLIFYLSYRMSQKQVFFYEKDYFDLKKQFDLNHHSYKESLKKSESEKGLLEDRIDLLKKEIQEKQNEIQSIDLLVETLKSDIHAKEEKISHLESEMEKRDQTFAQMQAEMLDLNDRIEGISDLEKLKNSNQELLEELNKLRVEKYQNNLMEESPKTETPKVSTSEQPSVEEEEKSKLLEEYEEKISQMKDAQHSLQQLKKQFKEKNDLLHETRSELFHAQNQLLAIERENELQKLEPCSLEWQFAQELQQENEQLEKENEELTELVSFLMEEISKNEDPPKENQPNFPF